MNRPRLTIRESAAACGVSVSTIRRKREAGTFVGAELDDRRGWLIPVEDLLAAGFRVNAPGVTTVPMPIEQALSEAVDAERAQLREDLAAARTEVRLLREMVGRQDTNLNDLRRQVLMLTSGQTEPDRSEPDHDQERGQSAVDEVPRQRWWSRAGEARHRRSKL